MDFKDKVLIISADGTARIGEALERAFPKRAKLMDYKDRVAFITGGAGGIGEALGRVFLENGCKVCLADIRDDVGELVTKKLEDEFGRENVLFVKCDVTSDKQFVDAYNICEVQLGRINILCNNAGVFSRDYRTSMDVNFGAVVRGTELALKRMGKHFGGTGGFVVNTASNFGAVPFPYTPMYCATKAAVIHYTRCMGDEFHYNYSGVHILAVCPGAVDTPFSNLEGMKKGTLNIQCDLVIKDVNDKALRLKPREVAEAILRVIEEHKPGAALLVQAGVEPYYLKPLSMDLS